MSGAYLDHAASTPLRPEAFDAMVPFLRDHHGNPSGRHAAARAARRAIDDARDAVAALVGCQPGEVVFTSGGTEADATAVASAAGAPGEVPGSVVVGAIEHHAVLDAAAALARHAGVVVVEVGVDAFGRVDGPALEAALDRADEPVRLVSVALANNELGTVTDLVPLAEVRDRRAPRARLHTDAVQAAAWLDLPVLAAPADLVSLSAHKLGGPKGVGALVVRGGEIEALIHGGGQERGRRSGTPNVAGIVGFGVAAEVLSAQRVELAAGVSDLRDRFAADLLERLRPLVPGARETVVTGADHSGVLPGHLHLLLPGVAADELLFLLDQESVAASAGASCSSGATAPSHVLAALGIEDDRARGAVRFSLGWTTTAEEIEVAAVAVEAAVRRLAPAPSSGS